MLFGTVVGRVFNFGMFREVVAEDLADLVDGSGDESPDDFGREFALRSLELLFDQGDETLQGLAFVVRDLQTGIGCKLQEQRQQVFRVDVDALDVVLLYSD